MTLNGFLRGTSSAKPGLLGKMGLLGIVIAVCGSFLVAPGARAEPRIEVVPTIKVPVPRPAFALGDARTNAPVVKATPVVNVTPVVDAPQPTAAPPLPVKRPAQAGTEKKPWDALPPETVAQKNEPTIAKSKCDRIAAPYKAAYERFSRRANSYWSQVSKKRSARRAKKKRGVRAVRDDYVLSHPPAYKGPKKPKCLDALAKKSPKKKRRKLPVVADFLRALKREYGHTPPLVSEKKFKQIYAAESLTQGLTADQVVGVYALETGGIGPYSRLSGIFPVDYKCRKIKPRGRAASTALGYSQLLAANSNAVLKSHGVAFAKRLEFRALMAPKARASELRAKAKLLRRIRRDIATGITRYSRRNNWREFIAFGRTSKGYAAHAMNLDPDVGPMMQVQKLKKIVQVATNKGHAPVSAAVLELLNLVGYGRGLEMITQVGRGVPTSNFFNRGGYYRNPVSRNLTAGGLLNKIAKIIVKRLKNCGSIEFNQVFREVAAGNVKPLGRKVAEQ